MSATLTSRPSDSNVDVRNMVEATGASIQIIDNTVIDPQMFSLTLQQANRPSVALLLKAGNQQITLFDLMSVFDQLGYHVDYHEIR